MKKNILLVDEEKEIHEIFKEYLDRSNYKLISAFNGNEALEKIIYEKSNFDVILLNISPGINGLESLKEIKKFDPQLPVIIITGYGTIESFINTNVFGCYYYLNKPFSLPHIKYLFERAINYKNNEMINKSTNDNKHLKIYNNKDLEIIRQLENETGIKLKKISNKENISVNDLISCQIDENQIVRTLFFGDIKLNKFPEAILKFNKLHALIFIKTSFLSLPKEIEKLKNLNILWIQSTQLTDIPPQIGRLKNLNKLILSDNQLTTLPKEIIQIPKLQSLYLDRNPLKKPPNEIANALNNIEAIKNYFNDLEEQGEDYVYEAKLILVGEPGAGKTSLAEKFLDPNYELNPTEPMTKGIEVKTWYFSNKNSIRFRANIWDFGGQHIMHATHRFFLTKRSLYIVLADNRKENTDFYYWLNIIELFGGKSPVLIVLNEKYKYKRYISENILSFFKSIQEVFNVDLADNMGFYNLTKAVQQIITSLPHIGKEPIPRKWVKIRRSLETDHRDYISRNEYLKICKKHGITTEEKAGHISEFLHDLGSILHFQKDNLLKNIIILNTQWATEAVYLILFDSIVIENYGEFDNSDLERIWNHPAYSDKHADLLRLMINFEICYEIGNSQKYIIPELLPENPPSENYPIEFISEGGERILSFEYRYTFMPKGIISHLIVKMNRYINDRLQWKSGVVLKIECTKAEIIENFHLKQLKIRILGRDKLETLTIIRNQLKEIHSFYGKLEINEMIPCNCIECINTENPYFYEYQLLKRYGKKNISEIRCGKSLLCVGVYSLINDVIINEKIIDNTSMNQNIIFKPEIKIEGQKHAVNIETETKIDLDVTLTNEIKVNINGLLGAFEDLKDELMDGTEIEKEKKDIEKEIRKAEQALEEIRYIQNKVEIKPGSMNRLRRFIEKIKDANTTIGKVFKAIKDGAGLARDFANYYNNIAQWCGCPQIPEFFLKKI